MRALGPCAAASRATVRGCKLASEVSEDEVTSSLSVRICAQARMTMDALERVFDDLTGFDDHGESTSRICETDKSASGSPSTRITSAHAPSAITPSLPPRIRLALARHFEQLSVARGQHLERFDVCVVLTSRAAIALWKRCGLRLEQEILCPKRF